MINRKLDEVSEEDINALITEERKESRTIEFKRELTLSSDGDKKEFLADVSSFANASGGDIIYGINEVEGVATEVVGLDGVLVDSDLLRIESIVQSGVAPRIIGVQFRFIALGSGRHCLVVRLPRSINRPHLVCYKGSSRFFSRNSAGKYPLEVHEIRAAFVASEGLAERVKELRVSRIGEILNGRLPTNLTGHSLACLHIIPFASFDPAYQFDLDHAKKLKDSAAPLDYGNGWSPSMNFDGILLDSRMSNGHVRSYLQIFRNGVIETVAGHLIGYDFNGTRIAHPRNEVEIVEALDAYLNFYKDLDVPLPIVVGLSLLRVRGVVMHSGSNIPPMGERPLAEDHLLLPPLIVEEYSANAANLLKNSFDQIWNAFGWDHDINFDKQGNWSPHRSFR